MPDDDLSWGVRNRFEFIEWRAYWEGRLNREDLERQFNISTPQASVDLKNYRERAPGNIEYDAGERAYFATPNFKERFLRLSPERYLLQLQSIKTGSVDIRETWFSQPPPVDVVPRLSRDVHAFVLRAILKAIRMRGEMEIYYQSLTNSRLRKICPHSLAYDGHRWHIRAWAPERAEFRDYVIGRILSYSEPKPCESDPPEDLEWITPVDLTLTAHPALTEEQRKAIEHDFQMEDGRKVLTLRLALAFYFITRHNLDLRGDELSPQRVQLYLENYDEYERTRASVKEAATALGATWRTRFLTPA